MILQVSKFYDPEIGGVESVVRDHAQYLSQFDEVVILCVKKRFSLKTSVEVREGVTVYRCASFGTFFSMPVSIVFFLYLGWLSRKANVIHLHEPFPLGSIGALLLRKQSKIFVTWHSDIVRQRLLKTFVTFFQERLLEKANLIITTSDNLLRSSDLLQRHAEKVTVLPLSIDVPQLREPSLLSDFPEPLPQDYVLFLGRLSYYKGVTILLDSLEHLDPRIPVVIVGNGELADYVSAFVADSDCNLRFVNRVVTDKEKSVILNNARLFVFPSTHDSEAFGIMQLEAMAYGVPVINTNLKTGVPWVSVNGVTGATVPVGDSFALAQTIRNLYFDESLISKYGSNARHRVLEIFDSEVVNENLRKIYFP